MAGYVFPQAHAAAIEAGRQRLALTAPRNPGSTAPHAELGQAVHLTTGAHGGARRRHLPSRTCILRGRVVITADAVLRVIDLRRIERGDHADQAEILTRIVQAAEHGVPGDLVAARDALADLAGFPDWAAAWTYSSHRDHRGRPDADGRVIRELIGWNA